MILSRQQEQSSASACGVSFILKGFNKLGELTSKNSEVTVCIPCTFRDDRSCEIFTTQ